MYPKVQLSGSLAILLYMAALSFPNPSVSDPYYDCGEIPVEPTIVDGSSSSMDQLVSNSAEVKDYIAKADVFLDCQEDLYKKNSLSRINREKLSTVIKSVTARRNDIRDEFNAQVEVYKKANP